MSPWAESLKEDQEAIRFIVDFKYDESPKLEPMAARYILLLGK